VKYGVCVNVDDADAYEEGGDDGAQAEMLFVAKRATRVRCYAWTSRIA
jgi:hypothetical protein